MVQMLILFWRFYRRFHVLKTVFLFAAFAALLSACQSQTPEPASAQLVSASTATLPIESAPTSTPQVVPHQVSPSATATSTIATTLTSTTTPTPTSTVTPSPTPTEVTRDNSSNDNQAAPLLQGLSSVSPHTGATPGGSQADGAPTRMIIPKIGVNAPIVVVGVLENGEMDAPKGPDEIAWYGDGVIPGQPGNALFGGHLDWGTRGAVFWRLRELRPGDRIEVVASDGNVLTFAVTSTNLYRADDAPADEIFASSDEPTITVVTCEGTFNRATRNYSHRRVVSASLVQ